MGVYVRPDSPYYWIALLRPGRPSLRESTGVLRHAPTKWQRDQLRQAAEEVYAKRVEQLARHRHDLPKDKPTITFAAFAAWYAENLIPKHRGAERDRELLAVLLKFFGRHELAAITGDLVTEYETQRTGKDRKKPGTANREVDLLKTMLAAAVPRYLEASPIAGRARLRTTKIRKRVVDATEEPRLLEQLAPRDQVLYLACVDTLARLGDILDLKRTDDQGTYLDFLDSKTGPYTVPVSARLRAGLDSLPPGPLEADLPYYFWWRRRAKTERDRRGAVRTMLQRACERCDPPIPFGRALVGITWHTGTRATGATRMLRRGVDPATVQTVGHWASLQQMSDYLSTTTPLQQAAVETIGQGADLAAAQAAGEAARRARASRKSPRESHVNGARRKGAETRGDARTPAAAQPRRSRGQIVKIA